VPLIGWAMAAVEGWRTHRRAELHTRLLHDQLADRRAMLDVAFTTLPGGLSGKGSASSKGDSGAVSKP
jgi:hypothetical protein